MSEESNERYEIVIKQETVELHDTETNKIVQIFAGADRLLAATAELSRLKERTELDAPDVDLTGTSSSERARDAAQIAVYVESPSLMSAPAAFLTETGAGKSIAPAAFLAETLPAVARRQRLESQLVQVIEIKEHARSEAARWHEISSAAWELQSRIEAALVRPLSSTETAQNAKGVVEDTEIGLGLLSASEALAEQRCPCGASRSLVHDCETVGRIS